MKENTSYKIKKIDNRRLSEMGFVRGAIFKVVKRVLGMIRIRLYNNTSNDVVIREETEKEIEYDEN